MLSPPEHPEQKLGAQPWMAPQQPRDVSQVTAGTHPVQDRLLVDRVVGEHAVIADVATTGGAGAGAQIGVLAAAHLLVEASDPLHQLARVDDVAALGPWCGHLVDAGRAWVRRAEHRLVVGVVPDRSLDDRAGIAANRARDVL